MKYYHGKTDRIYNRYFYLPSDHVIRYQKFNSKIINSKSHLNVLICPGRASPIEKYENVVATLTSRGYNVWCLDWRGQGLSSREAGFKCHISNYDHHINDLNLFIDRFLHDKPLILLAHSMGAHIALRYIAEYPEKAQAALLTAPMIDICTGIYGKKGAYALSKTMVQLGLGKNYVYRQGSYNTAAQPFEGNILTHNKELFYYHRHLQIKKPEINTGGITFGWVKATLDSISYTNRKEFLSHIKAPVKILTADEEKIADNSQVRKIASYIPKCSVRRLKGTRHQLLAEVPEVLEKIYSELDVLSENLAGKSIKK